MVVDKAHKPAGVFLYVGEGFPLTQPPVCCVSHVSTPMFLDQNQVKIVDNRDSLKAFGVIRHVYGTFLLKASQNIKLVKEQLGHSSINTTEIYISLIKEDTKAALAKLYRIKKREFEPENPKPVKKKRVENNIIAAKTLSVEELILRFYEAIAETPKHRKSGGRRLLHSAKRCCQRIV